MQRAEAADIAVVAELRRRRRVNAPPALITDAAELEDVVARAQRERVQPTVNAASSRCRCRLRRVRLGALSGEIAAMTLSGPVSTPPRVRVGVKMRSSSASDSSSAKRGVGGAAEDRCPSPRVAGSMVTCPTVAVMPDVAPIDIRSALMMTSPESR